MHAAHDAFDFFTMTVRQLQGNVLYEFRTRQAKARPFVFGGIGATFFSADNLQSETKLSFDYGAGLTTSRGGASASVPTPVHTHGTARHIGR